MITGSCGAYLKLIAEASTTNGRVQVESFLSIEIGTFDYKCGSSWLQSGQINICKIAQIILELLSVVKIWLCNTLLIGFRRLDRLKLLTGEV